MPRKGLGGAGGIETPSAWSSAAFYGRSLVLLSATRSTRLSWLPKPHPFSSLRREPALALRRGPFVWSAAARFEARGAAQRPACPGHGYWSDHNGGVLGQEGFDFLVGDSDRCVVVSVGAYGSPHSLK
jgi:hypothetical protein